MSAFAPPPNHEPRKNPLLVDPVELAFFVCFFSFPPGVPGGLDAVDVGVDVGGESVNTCGGNLGQFENMCQKTHVFVFGTYNRHIAVAHVRSHRIGVQVRNSKDVDRNAAFVTAAGPLRILQSQSAPIHLGCFNRTHKPPCLLVIINTDALVQPLHVIALTPRLVSTARSNTSMTARHNLSQVMTNLCVAKLAGGIVHNEPPCTQET